MKWQPIETAPTDGTRILLRGKDGKIADGHYGQPDGYANPKQFVWPYIHANPTHWRPLPEPPESAAAPAQADRDAPVELPEPRAWEVWWGLGSMRPHGTVFRTKAEADAVAASIKSITEVRPLFGDAREAAGYARGFAAAQKGGE